ncbi:F0F1 ATP synthase subunit B [Mesorhizobium koreense]|jgi:F-type H+-transporting ATPase subunit b|uniref:F0F1 ATP synthase subunit B n=1 Tax=Mesorhizobium koreense TaxID=3074855 RepID=UPI00287B9407|nr:F0F1 ATP synthase subunit B [Mesorhizobium sp. WR6]
MDATSWATLWALIGLIIFLGICLYIKAPAMLAKSLDERAKRISDELDEAKRLRDEAKALLAEYQKKRKDAETEAADILTAAKREAELFVEDAKAKAEDYVARRTASAEQKIAQAERDAVNEVRSLAADIAVEAARRTIAAKVDAKTTASLFESSLQALKSKLN